MFIGVMSGTSMDGVDVAAVDFSTTQPTLVASHSAPWADTLLQRVRAFADGECLDAGAFTSLDHEVGGLFARAVNTLLHEAGLAAPQVIAIGCHGQTVSHLPDDTPATTLQLGDANMIAEHTGITTINDFRRRDMAAGGQGAPLAPAFHAAMLRDTSEDRVVLNLGGIANVTLLRRDRDQAVVGFDTGPANCLMDVWCKLHTGRTYDENGDWAASAISDPTLLTAMLQDPYFAIGPPKSTSTQYFSSDWLNAKLDAHPGLDAATVQATLLELSATSVVDAVNRYAANSARILVCGGGAHNRVLMRRLDALSGLPVETTAALGIDPDWMEAMAFAWLAKRTLEGLPGNLPDVTGAAGERILGAIHAV